MILQLLTAIFFAATPQTAVFPAKCGPYEEVLALAEEQYPERPQVLRASNGVKMLLFGTAGDWGLLLPGKTGIGCIIYSDAEQPPGVTL